MTTESDYSVVLGVDRGHLKKLRQVLPTWQKHKPSILKGRPLYVFLDANDGEELLTAADEVFRDNGVEVVQYYWWPKSWVAYHGYEDSKWFHPQRMKMLSGFVYTAAELVQTKYWLKLDLDVVATGNDDWVHPEWLTADNAIVCHRWGYTKPPNQMDQLDLWVSKNRANLPEFDGTEALDMHPSPGATALGHKRIISWCGFFDTEFTKLVARCCSRIEGDCKLPVPSQDGVMWYFAKRLGLPILRANMKSVGWSHQSSLRNVKKAAMEAMS